MGCIDRTAIRAGAALHHSGCRYRIWHAYSTRRLRFHLCSAFSVTVSARLQALAYPPRQIAFVLVAVVGKPDGA
jgi:hypothetical protein